MPYAVLAAAAGILTACGGPADSTAEPEAETSASATPSYALEDRETFLATGPGCEELEAWYDQFPADTDGLTALRYIEACNEAPQPVLDRNIYAGSNERMLEALLQPEVSGKSRATAHWAIAKAACEMFSSDQKSLWLVGSDVRDYGGTAEDYAAVIDAAVQECPSNADDLTLFATDDVLSTTTELIQSLRRSGADLGSFGADPDDQVAGLAAVACKSARDGDAEGNGFFFATLLDVDAPTGEALASEAVRAFCPRWA